MRIIIGIDPGVHTGLCMLVDGKISLIATTNFAGAIQTITSATQTVVCVGESVDSCLKVVIEDPSQNAPVFDYYIAKLLKHPTKTELLKVLKIAQNIGANKREGTLIIEWCEKIGVRYLAVKPSARSITKLSAEQFAKITGYTGKSSEHSRDAAMLIWGMK